MKRKTARKTVRQARQPARSPTQRKRGEAQEWTVSIPCICGCGQIASITLYNIFAAAQWMGVKPETISRWVYVAKTLVADYRIGGTLLFTTETLEQCRDARLNTPTHVRYTYSNGDSMVVSNVPPVRERQNHVPDAKREDGQDG